MNDPIVEEGRRIRDEHARKFGYDLAAICADIRRHQTSCGHRIVRLSKRKTKSRQEQSSLASLEDVLPYGTDLWKWT